MLYDGAYGATRLPSAVTGTSAYEPGEVFTVTVTAHYDAKILPISGDVTGRSSSRIAYGVGTDESGG
jgi:hypothetical protein